MTHTKRCIDLKEKLGNLTLEIDYIQDSGHGWIKIPKNLSLGLNFSKYSYQDKNYLYLEEDQDANEYIRELNKVNINYIYNEIIINGYSKIRNLDRI